MLPRPSRASTAVGSATSSPTPTPTRGSNPAMWPPTAAATATTAGTSFSATKTTPDRSDPRPAVPPSHSAPKTLQNDSTTPFESFRAENPAERLHHTLRVIPHRKPCRTTQPHPSSHSGPQPRSKNSASSSRVEMNHSISSPTAGWVDRSPPSPTSDSATLLARSTHSRSRAREASLRSVRPDWC